MRKLPFLFLLICLGMTMTTAQSLDRQVISSMGNFSTTTGLQLSATAGEPATQTLLSGTIMLTQGFQQPDEDIAGAIGDLEVKMGYTIYPNPTQDRIFISLETQTPVTLNLRITDLSGRQILPEMTDLQVNGSMTRQIDLSQFSSGTYLVHILDTQHQLQKTVKVMKVD